MRIIAKFAALLAFTSLFAHAMEPSASPTSVKNPSGLNYGTEIERNWLVKLYSLFHELERLVSKPDFDLNAADTFFDNVLSLIRDQKAAYFVDHPEESLDLFGKDRNICDAVANFLKDNRELLTIDINFVENQKQQLRDNFSYLTHLKLLAQKTWFEKMFNLYQDIKKVTIKKRKLDKNAAETFLDSVNSLIRDNEVQNFIDDWKSFSYQFGDLKELCDLVAGFLREHRQLLTSMDTEFLMKQKRKIRENISYLEKNAQ